MENSATSGQEPPQRPTSVPVDVPGQAAAAISKKGRKKKSLLEYRKLTFKMKYDQKELLGSGALSNVYNCLDTVSGLEYAVKIVKMTNTHHRRRLLGEVEVLHMCRNHPHIVHFVEYFEEGNLFHMVFSKVVGGPLLEHIAEKSTFSESEVIAVTGEISDALDFLHSHGIAHRDLKPANILCENPNSVVPVRMCDFDLASNTFGHTRDSITTPELQTPVGSCEFMAPEVVKRFNDDDWSTYDKKCDIWSLGVILYIMLCGYAPFEGNCGRKSCDWNNGGSCTLCHREVVSRIVQGDYSCEGKGWKHVSHRAKDFLSHLLVTDARERYTVKQVLRHPFLSLDKCSPRPLDTPHMLKRSGSNCSIDLFSKAAMSAVRQFSSKSQSSTSLVTLKEETAAFELLPVDVFSVDINDDDGGDGNAGSGDDDNGNRGGGDSDDDDDCGSEDDDLSCTPKADLALQMPAMSALAQRRLQFSSSSVSSDGASMASVSSAVASMDLK